MLCLRRVMESDLWVWQLSWFESFHLSGSDSREVVKRKVERNGRNLHPGAGAAAGFMFVVQREELWVSCTLSIRGSFCSLMLLKSLSNLWAPSVGRGE